MSFNRAVRTYVWAVVTAAVVLLGITSTFQRPPLDYWALFSLVLAGCLLEVSGTRSHSRGLAGSLVFVFHLAIGLILGAMWGGITAGFVKTVSQLRDRTTLLKGIFNTAERIVTVTLTFSIYSLLGGKTPPTFLFPPAGHAPINFNDALLEVAIFLASAFIYFVANSIIVNAAVALATKKPVLLTWRSNTFWVLGYDIAASLLALGVVFVFVWTNRGHGLERFIFLGIFLPLVAARIFYNKLNTLQDLYGELDGAYEQLELNVREQLAMMVKAIEARDPYTSGHSRRVCGLSRAIASDLGLTQEEVEDIENAALLHDVGKIHAEFAPLLQKEGKLTDEEWAVMKTHSTKSAELVSLFSHFEGYVVSCVRHHHERWDGRGYPDGVAGDAIPLGARIITIADTIDAMTTNRPYRNALSLDVVLGELNRGRSTQFDASLVELTVNSVTVRRLISDPTSIPEHLPQPRIRARAAEAHRRGRLVSSGGGSPSAPAKSDLA
ncbi:MAG TPA: HD-GYP domain-containing protein [Gemmatimonadales bacterium]|jgi:HD-GYP domain-containing protein (c-di-GMP phosphodiesterase class II)|nr:HD-GYP domain-containing protein [Gemmatimonadales bacterium]